MEFIVLNICSFLLTQNDIRSYRILGPPLPADGHEEFHLHVAVQYVCRADLSVSFFESEDAGDTFLRNVGWISRH
jgi:hypothetical protein